MLAGTNLHKNISGHNENCLTRNTDSTIKALHPWKFRLS